MSNRVQKTHPSLVAIIAGIAVMAACSSADPTPTSPPPNTPTATAEPAATTATDTTQSPSATSPVSLGASLDNTLYEDDAGAVSSGQGFHLIAGMTNNMSARRGVIAFDVAGNIPAGSTIESVTFTIIMDRTNVKAGARVIGLHTLTKEWGEGTSNALFQPGQGVPAATSDATWLHTFFDTAMWDTPGGDFSATVSGTAEVDGNGPYTWNSTPQMVGDVQSWLDDPSGNFGWLLLGDESEVSTAKRFHSSEALLEENRPVLVIEFS